MDENEALSLILAILEEHDRRFNELLNRIAQHDELMQTHGNRDAPKDMRKIFTALQNGGMVYADELQPDTSALEGATGEGLHTGFTSEDYPHKFDTLIKGISRKWSWKLLEELYINPWCRYSELLRKFKGMSPRTLANRLKELNLIGLVERQSFNETPLRVEYSLSDDGAELIKLMSSIRTWNRIRSSNSPPES